MRRALWSLLAAAIIAQVACLSQKNCTVKINSLSSGTNISTASMSSPDDCAKACEASERCCVAEFNKDLNQCYLKTGGEATGWHQDVCAITCVPACILPPTPPPTPKPPSPKPPTPVPTPVPVAPACSLNGEGSPCKCDAGWTGTNCGQLDLLPAPAFSKQVVPIAATVSNNTLANSTWGMSVVGPDKEGVLHGYMTEIANHCPLGDYGTASQVVHMTATAPLGPWTRQGVALKGFAHNPQAVMAPNGSVLLFHIGQELPDGCVKDCSGGPAPKPSQPCPRLGHGTSVAVGESFDGPWTRYSYILGSGPTNPAPYIFPNGTIFLGTRRTTSSVYPAWVGHAASPKGPWAPFKTEVVSTAAGSATARSGSEEDSFVFKTGRGYHMLTHRAVSHGHWPPSPSTGCGGGHLYSTDMRTWFFGEDIYAHNASGDAQCDIQLAAAGATAGAGAGATATAGAGGGGEASLYKLTSRQRPTVFAAKDGSLFLFTGASGNPSGPNVTEYGHSFTLVQQIGASGSGGGSGGGGGGGES